MLCVRLLGELGLELDGSPLRPPARRRSRSLLAWLALHPGAHARGELAGLFWPDVLESSARESLRTALAGLRRSLGPDPGRFLLATRDAVGLAGDGEVWVDVLAFGQLLDDGRLEDALELSRGELLQGFDDDWVYEARAVHRERVGEALAMLAARAEREGELQAAVRFARRRLALDPLSEAVARELIRLLAAADDRPAALAAYARLRQRLRDELGIGPSAAVQRLVDEIRADSVVASTQPVAPPSRVPLPEPLTADSPTRLVGRAAALERLDDALARVRGGARELVAISGEPGIGKTRLASEFCRQAYAQGATVLLGRAFEQPIAPHQPFSEAVRRYVAAVPTGRVRAQLGSLWAELGRLMPELAEPAELAASLPEEGEWERYRLFEAVSELLSCAAQPQPLILMLDDLHWAESPARLLLRHLLLNPPQDRLLVVATYREEAGGDVLAVLDDLQRAGCLTRVALERLSAQDVTTLLDDWTHGDAPPTLATEVHNRTEGNPLLVVELMRHLSHPADPHQLQAGPYSVDVPESIKQLTARRLARLGDVPKQLVAVAAVAGREFSFALLERVLASADVALCDALEQAIGAGVVVELPGDVGRYAFTHALTRDAIYDDLTATTRARLHLRVGQALEELTADAEEPAHTQIAHHYVRAGALGDRRKALDHSERAARFAGGQLDHERAAAHYHDALRMIRPSNLADRARRCELLLALADAQRKTGDTTEVRATLLQAAELARALHAPKQLAAAALALGALLYAPTPEPVDRVVIALIEEALAAIEDTDLALRARLLAQLATELYYDNTPARVASLAQQAVRAARESGDRSAVGAALRAQHLALTIAAHPRDRLAVAEAMIETGERADHELVLWGRIWKAVDLLELGNLVGFDTEAQSFEALAAELRQPAYAWWPALWRAMHALLDGDLEQAEQLIAHAYQAGEPAHGDAAFAQYCAQLFWLRREQGRLAELDQLAEQAVDRLPGIPGVRSARALLLAELGRTREARAELAQLAANDFSALPRDLNWPFSASMLAETCASLNEIHVANALYALLTPLADLYVCTGYAAVCCGPISYYLGLLSATAGNTHAATAHLSDALEQTRALDSPALTARVEQALTPQG